MGRKDGKTSLYIRDWIQAGMVSSRELVHTGILLIRALNVHTAVVAIMLSRELCYGSHKSSAAKYLLFRRL